MHLDSLPLNFSTEWSLASVPSGKPNLLLKTLNKVRLASFDLRMKGMINDG